MRENKKKKFIFQRDEKGGLRGVGCSGKKAPKYGAAVVKRKVYVAVGCGCVCTHWWPKRRLASSHPH